MSEVVIVWAKRTPIGRAGGQFHTLEPSDLVAPLLKQAIKDTVGDASLVDDVMIGNVVGPGGNVARVSLLQAGFPVTVPGVTIDRQCGSGLEAIMRGFEAIKSGQAQIILAGGVESVSRAPWKMAQPTRPGAVPTLYTRAPFTPAAYGDPDMGIAAEEVAARYQITREAQDYYAFTSHQKAVTSQRTGRFNKEILPLQGVMTDECPRADTSVEKLAHLHPVFLPEGTVTAGNACPLNDGAAIVMLMSREACLHYKLTAYATIVDATAAGVMPDILGMGPVPATQKLLARQQLQVTDIDIVEFNEAFASQVLACLQQLKIPQHLVNIGGGALALGHPYGASGAILITRLVHELKKGQRGLATLGIGGGMGLSMLVTR